MIVTVRNWLPDDSAAVADVMYRSVHEAAAGAYSAEHGVVLLRPDRDVEPGSAIG